FEPIPNEFQTAIKAAMAGGTAPDLFYVDADLFINFAPNDLLLDLGPYMEIAGVTVEDYPAGLINQWITPDGEVMGIPKDFNSLAVFYLPEYFEAAGVAMPAEGWTWDDLRAAAEAITAAGETVGMCTPPDAGRWPALVIAAGGGIMNADYTEALFNSPEAVAATEFFYGMYADGVGASPADIGMGWCGEALGNKLTAMGFEGGWLVNYLNTQFPDVEWAVAPMPTTPDGGEGNLLFQNAWGVNANTEYPNAAALLTLFLTSPMNQQPIAESGFALPTHMGLLADNDFLAELDLSSRVLLAGAVSGEAFFYGEFNGEVIGAFGNALNAIWLGEKDVQTALDDAVAEVNEIVADD
ncbi:MAG: extracellular solute-binding protein, partial [Anaerolineae bacterium]|nr:extracellular solute-binding protein [Anaerolineae bacterium]